MALAKKQFEFGDRVTVKRQFKGKVMTADGNTVIVLNAADNVAYLVSREEVSHDVQ